MTAKQLHHLKPGDRVKRKGEVRTWIVAGVVVYLTRQTQTVDAVKLGGTLYQRHEMLTGFDVVPA